MPYIKPEDREIFDEWIYFLADFCNTSGEMNYIITKFFHLMAVKNKLCYDMLNSTIGVLECAKLELYRQIAAKYEDKKKRENGAISELDAKTLEDVR